MIRSIVAVFALFTIAACVGDTITATDKSTPTAAPSAAVASQSAPTNDPFAAFAPYSPATRYQLDHQPWTKFLRTAVYITGRSNRVAARRDDNSRQTGTKATTGSKSRYRFEGNRVLFHLFDDGAINYVGVYRQALQDTMGRINYGDLRV